MPRIRTVKPELWSHPVMGRQDDSVKTMGVALLNWADDEGYFYADPAAIRSFARPFDDDSKTTLGCLQQLMKIEYIEVRQHSIRGFVGRVVSFDEHQRVDKPKDSKIKKFFDEAVSIISLGIVQDASKTLPAGKEGKGKEEEEPLRPSKTDVRYQPFVEALEKYWTHKNPQVRFSINRADGKQIKQFLADHPNATIEQFRTCLNNRGKSEVVHSQAIHRWIGRILEFFEGPLDKFWKPKDGRASPPVVIPRGRDAAADLDAQLGVKQ